MSNSIYLAGRAIPYIIALNVSLFSFSAVNIWHAELNWHDQQRIFQLALLGLASLLFLFRPVVNLPAAALTVIVLIFFMGACSVIQSDWKWWGFKEWGRYAGLVLLSLLIGALGERDRNTKFAFGLITFVGSIHAFQFLVHYLSAFISGIMLLKSDLLFPGFSNPRFFAQFQILLMPVLACLVLRVRRKNFIFSMLLGAILSVQWCIGFMLGGRGLWIGLIGSSVMMCLVVPHYWRLIWVQLVAALFGIILFILMFILIPAWLELTPDLRDSLRTGLSGREIIWSLAWEMSLAHPWLGVGPMHFSATFNPVAAHPHQVLLQWAAEWGLPATLMALVLGLWGMGSSVGRLRGNNPDYMAAARWLAIAGALLLAQVDGVFVMPYVETWLAILIGLSLPEISALASNRPVQRHLFQVMAIMVVFMTGHVLITEAPVIAESGGADSETNRLDWTPRFWAHGWIPMDGG